MCSPCTGTILGPWAPQWRRRRWLGDPGADSVGFAPPEGCTAFGRQTIGAWLELPLPLPARAGGAGPRPRPRPLDCWGLGCRRPKNEAVVCASYGVGVPTSGLGRGVRASSRRKSGVGAPGRSDDPGLPFGVGKTEGCGSTSGDADGADSISGEATGPDDASAPVRPTRGATSGSGSGPIRGRVIMAASSSLGKEGSAAQSGSLQWTSQAARRQHPSAAHRGRLGRHRESRPR